MENKTKMKKDCCYRVYNIYDTPADGSKDYFDMCDKEQAKRLSIKLSENKDLKKEEWCWCSPHEYDENIQKPKEE